MLEELTGEGKSRSMGSEGGGAIAAAGSGGAVPGDVDGEAAGRR